MNSDPPTPRENRASGAALGLWSRRLVVAAALVAVMFVGAEATVRIEDRIRWGTPLFSPEAEIADLGVLDANGRHPAPGTSFRQWRINSVGTRGPEPDASGRTPRALVLGASETFGLYETDNHEYVRQLADTLLAGKCDADLLNGAFPGMSLPTVEQDFRLRLARLRPRVAVYYPTPAQYLDRDLPRPVRPDSSGRVAPAWRRWHSRFLARLRGQFKLMLPVRIQDWARQLDIARVRRTIPADSLFSQIPTARLDAFDGDLRRLVGTLRAHGATPILVTHANAFTGDPPASDDRLRAWERFYPLAGGDMLVRFDSAAAIRVRRIAADSNVVLVDAWQAFHNVPSQAMFADFAHFTDLGAARMATLLKPAVGTALGCQPPARVVQE